MPLPRFGNITSPGAMEHLVKRLGNVRAFQMMSEADSHSHSAVNWLPSCDEAPTPRPPLCRAKTAPESTSRAFPIVEDAYATDSEKENVHTSQEEILVYANRGLSLIVDDRSPSDISQSWTPVAETDDDNCLMLTEARVPMYHPRVSQLKNEAPSPSANSPLSLTHPLISSAAGPARSHPSSPLSISPSRSPDPETDDTLPSFPQLSRPAASGLLLIDMMDEGWPQEQYNVPAQRKSLKRPHLAPLQPELNGQLLDRPPSLSHASKRRRASLDGRVETPSFTCPQRKSSNTFKKPPLPFRSPQAVGSSKFDPFNPPSSSATSVQVDPFTREPFAADAEPSAFDPFNPPALPEGIQIDPWTGLPFELTAAPVPAVPITHSSAIHVSTNAPAKRTSFIEAGCPVVPTGHLTSQYDPCAPPLLERRSSDPGEVDPYHPANHPTAMFTPPTSRQASSRTLPTLSKLKIGGAQPLARALSGSSLNRTLSGSKLNTSLRDLATFTTAQSGDELSAISMSENDGPQMFVPGMTGRENVRWGLLDESTPRFAKDMPLPGFQTLYGTLFWQPKESGRASAASFL